VDDGGRLDNIVQDRRERSTGVETSQDCAFNQPRRFLHSSGAAVYFGSRHESQPIVFDAPGESCELLGASQLVKMAQVLGGRVSRVDVAADVEPAELARRRISQMRRELLRGRCETRIPTDSMDLVKSDRPGEGWTLYVGSRSSECFLRAYDRRGPLRLEWEFKPLRSVRAAVPDAIARYGASGLWRQLATRCIWPMPWYREVLEGACTDLQHEAAGPDDLTRWMAAIVKQIGPNLAALALAGIPLTELAVMPVKPNAQQLRRWDQWCVQARELGYDPVKLEREVKRWRRR